MWAFLCCKALGLARHPTDNFSTDCSFLCTRTQFKWYKTLVLAYFVQISIKKGSIISGVLRRHLLFWDSSHLSCQHWVYLGVCACLWEIIILPPIRTRTVHSYLRFSGTGRSYGLATERKTITLCCFGENWDFLFVQHAENEYWFRNLHQVYGDSIERSTGTWLLSVS